MAQNSGFIDCRLKGNPVTADCLTVNAAGTLIEEMAKNLPTALAALVVGALAAAIAFQQFRVARAKLKLDLFEKRYEIFEKTWGFLSMMVQKGPPSGLYSNFDNLIPQAEFLFGKDVADYMRTASRYSTELWMIQKKTEARGDVMPAEDIKRHTEIHQWFYNEGSHGARTVFGKYLDFSTWH